MRELQWRKSNYSGKTDECVEVADTDGSTAIRDSKDPRGAQLRVSTGSWRSFLAHIKASEHDRP